MIYRCSCGHRFVRNVDASEESFRYVWIDHKQGSDKCWHRVRSCPTCGVLLSRQPPIPEAERLPFPD